MVDHEAGCVTEALWSEPRVIAVTRNHENIDRFSDGVYHLAFDATASTDQLNVGLPNPPRGRGEQL